MSPPEAEDIIGRMYLSPNENCKKAKCFCKTSIVRPLPSTKLTSCLECVALDRVCQPSEDVCVGDRSFVLKGGSLLLRSAPQNRTHCRNEVDEELSDSVQQKTKPI